MKTERAQRLERVLRACITVTHLMRLEPRRFLDCLRQKPLQHPLVFGP